VYLLFQRHLEQRCVSDEGQDQGMVDSTQKYHARYGQVTGKKFLKHIKRGRNKPTTPAKEALVYDQVRLKNGVTEASHAEYLQAKKRAQMDGISLLDDDDNGEVEADDDSVLSRVEIQEHFALESTK
jgi:hypothetical protein